MSILWNKIEFYKGKSYCEAIVIVVLGMGKSLGRFSGDKTIFPPF